MRIRNTVPLLLLSVAAACESSPTTSGDSLVLDPRFHEGVADGWVVEFADYPPADADIYDLESGIRNLPAPLDTSRKALYVAGSNRSDDLFMFLKRPVDGLAPNAVYEVRFEIEIATNEGSGCMGIGGAPGESVVMKAGASTTEPRVVLESDGHYRVNIDKGNQVQGGTQMVSTDHIANGSEVCSDGDYRLKTIDSDWNKMSELHGEPAERNQILAKSDSSGRLWLVVGTDSGYEGITRLYYTGIRVELERQ